MKDPFVFELGCEELPASHCHSIVDQLNPDVIKEIADKHNINFGRPRIFVTPRRISLLTDFAEPIQTLTEVKGPLYEAAYENGKPNMIAHKFSQSHGTTPDKLNFKTENGKKFIYVSKNLGAQFPNDVQNFITEMIKRISFERPMRWDNSGFKFSRPIRWILCIHGRRTVPIEIGSLHSSNITYGPRFTGSKQFSIPNAGSYEDMLAKNHIIVDHRKRHMLIEKILDTLEQAQGLACTNSREELIEEVTFLVEYPHPMICRFNKQFLSLPEPVISTVLRKHQRYFPLYDTIRKSMSHVFLVVANYDKESALISQGNEMVVNARLRDAVFFFEQDMLVPLSEFAEKTKRISFQERLGSVFDKSKRIEAIALKIAVHMNLSVEDLTIAASLAKADLSSALVIEFSSLEGIMGSIYAENEGMKPSVCSAIREHYLPRSAQDPLPKGDTGTILALADRIDTLYCMFGINAIPKGNSDPYGLRRAAIAIIRILWEKELSISLETLVECAASAAPVKAGADKIIEFILQRSEQNFKDSGYQHIPTDTNTVRSVIFNSDSSMVHKKNTLAELSSRKNTHIIDEVLELAKRIYNIAVKNQEVAKSTIKQSTLNPSEKAFLWAISALQSKSSLTVSDLNTLVKPGNEFFDKNMVMSEVAAEKNRRLALLLMAHEQIGRLINVKYILN